MDKAIRRATEKQDEEKQEITDEEKEDYIDERTQYRNEYDRVLEKQIVVDELTGLANRKGFTDELERALKSVRQSVEKQHFEKQRSNEHLALEEFSLLVIDLDNFKRLNDTLGHTAGDNALKKVAEIVKKSVRQGDVSARFHGDEFAVFLPRADETNAREISGKILDNLKEDPELQKFGVSASIGVRHINTSNLTELTTPETLVTEADLQQMKAKQNGKGKVEIHQGQ